MRPAYLVHHQAGGDRWMISYLDVMTILLILFVAVAAHLRSATPAPAPVPVTQPVSESYGSMIGLSAIKKELDQSGVDVRRDSRGVVVSLPQTLLFGPGEDRVNQDAMVAVSAIADVLRKVPNNITVVGHTDAVPIHNQRFNNNWELAAARGLRLLDLLTSRYGIQESRLSVESYGSNAPQSSNDTPDGRASNRRVEIVIHEDTPKTNQ